MSVRIPYAAAHSLEHVGSMLAAIADDLRTAADTRAPSRLALLRTRRVARQRTMPSLPEPADRKETGRLVAVPVTRSPRPLPADLQALRERIGLLDVPFDVRRAWITQIEQIGGAGPLARHAAPDRLRSLATAADLLRRELVIGASSSTLVAGCCSSLLIA